jgi:hypothetical protein
VLSDPALLFALAVCTLVALLLTRPPFVVRFEHDQKRPWRASQRVCWLSVAVVTALATATPLAASRFL